jgi:hypothetical protein
VGGIGSEPDAVPAVETLRRPDEPEVALSDQVFKGQPEAHVTPSNRNHQAEVRAHEEVACFGIAIGDPIGESTLVDGRKSRKILDREIGR